MIYDLVQRCTKERPHNIYFMHVVDALIRLVVGNIHVSSAPTGTTLMATLEHIATQNMSYWVTDDIRHALAHLDNTILRVAKKFCMKYLMEAIQKAMTDRAAAISKEEHLSTIDLLPGRMQQQTLSLAQYLWAQFSAQPTSDGLWTSVWNLEAFEASDLPDVPRYPPGESDLLYFEWYGQTFDLLSLGTWDALNSAQSSLAAAGAPDSLLRIATLTRDEVVAKLPQPMSVPPGFMPLPDAVRVRVVQHFKNMLDTIARLQRYE